MPLLKAGSQLLGGGAREWYLAGGAPTPVAAYQAKGAASLAASYINLAQPGTYNAAPGTPPAWAADTGWTFNGTTNSRYLTTGYTVPGDQSHTIIVRISGASGMGAVVGSRTAGGKSIMIYMDSSGGAAAYYYGSLSSRTPYIAAGVLALAGRQPYRDGTADGGQLTVDSFTADAALYIGNRSGLNAYYTGNVLAMAIYSSTLTAPQVAAVSAAMALL